jgi:hypothetical protein
MFEAKHIGIGKLLLLLAAVIAAPSVVVANQAGDDDVSRRFEEVRALRSQGRFDQAIQLLERFVEERTESDEILRRAFNELVFSILSKRSMASDVEEQDRIYREAVSRAEQALTRFPDLTADRIAFPPDIDLIYDTLRKSMFGSLEVTAPLDSCRVFVNDVYQGTTPLSMRYHPVGDYTLTVTKSGYVDRETPVTILPGRDLQLEVTLNPQRGKKWWLTRVIAPVAAVAAVVVALVLPGDDQPSEEPAEPLPEPPPPPAR